jgi:hypothetical protein
MSGDAHITGRIRITPPITWRELADKKWATGASERFGGPYPDAKVELDQRDVDTDQGVLSVRAGVAIVPEGGETNGYTLTEDVDRIVREFTTAPDGTIRRFEGWLHLVWAGGEEIHRLHVVDGAAVEACPQVVWPVGARDEDAAAPEGGAR